MTPQVGKHRDETSEDIWRELWNTEFQHCDRRRFNDVALSNRERRNGRV